MSQFELTILGCSSATPTSTRNPTAQLLQVAGRFFLIDCGEATQIQLRKFKVKFQRIDHIFISHLHGDHYLGLMGLLSSMHLLGRTRELHLYCPAGLDEIIQVQLKHSATVLNYMIHYRFHDTNRQELIFEDEKLTVQTIILNHRIPCCGFLFTEKPKPRNLKKEALEEYRIPVSAIQPIRNGEDYVSPEGSRIPNSQLAYACLPVFSYAYCSDTCYDQEVINQVRNATVLYHESTFTEEMRKRAQETHHSTAMDAGKVALQAGVGKLILGHYSARYTDLQPLLDEARSVFPNSVLAYEGLKINVDE
ncbi:MAG TPA: ribonuclease Z [Bacteroidia bacterium]|jgi:ribonuclease Z|nr:ribonuclease Z [Bacteroidia bacterium]